MSDWMDKKPKDLRNGCLFAVISSLLGWLGIAYVVKTIIDH